MGWVFLHAEGIFSLSATNTNVFSKIFHFANGVSFSFFREIRR